MTEDELKLEKLQLEINELRNRLSQYQKLLSFLPLLTIIITIGGIWYNFHQFSESQNSQSLKEQNAREDEFRKPFFQKQLDLYEKAVISASKVVYSVEGTEERINAEKDFFQLYSGVLHLVADKKFTDAKIDFAMCLGKDTLNSKYTKCLSEISRSKELHNYSVILAQAAKESIKDSWKLDKIPKENITK